MHTIKAVVPVVPPLSDVPAKAIDYANSERAAAYSKIANAAASNDDTLDVVDVVAAPHSLQKAAEKARQEFRFPWLDAIFSVIVLTLGIGLMVAVYAIFNQPPTDKARKTAETLAMFYTSRLVFSSVFGVLTLGVLILGAWVSWNVVSSACFGRGNSARKAIGNMATQVICLGGKLGYFYDNQVGQVRVFAFDAILKAEMVGDRYVVTSRSGSVIARIEGADMDAAAFVTRRITRELRRAEVV